MQISLKSLTHSFSRSKSRNLQRGFTLIELLISIAIIGVLTSIILVRHGAFDSTILLKGVAYEAGLNIREAQVRSVSASQGTGGFNKPFGVSFTTATPKEYVIFSDENDPTVLPPQYESAAGEEIETVTIPRTMQIDDLDVRAGGLDRDDVRRIDVSFKRPEYE